MARQPSQPTAGHHSRQAYHTCYRMFMPKTPLSVTLANDNLVWLRGVAARGKRKSLSEALDDILTSARLGGGPAGTVRSVIGTVDIATDDPDLAGADEYIHSVFAGALAKPLVVRERASGLRATKRPRRG